MSSLEFEQQASKTLAEIGAHLRDVRQQQTKDLDEISAQTLIPARLLSAIEEGQVEELPELIYTRGMIRRFANTLGLDGAKLVASLGGTQPAAQKNLVKAKRSGNSGGGLKPFHLYLLYIVVILAAGSGLSYMINQSALTLDDAAVTPSSSENSSSSQKESPKVSPISKPAPATSSPPSGAAVSPAPAAVNAPVTASPSPVASPASDQEVAASSTSPQPNAAPLRVDMSVKQDAWVEIVADGKTSYSGILTAGTSRTITAQKKLVVRSGNAGGVLLAVNKKPAQLMGQLGAIKELILEPENTDQSSQAINPNESADG
ncbi:MAG: helix-turn-helix domain-containing protein [Thermosynechococcaceae cyanobacterium]